MLNIQVISAVRAHREMGVCTNMEEEGEEEGQEVEEGQGVEEGGGRRLGSVGFYPLDLWRKL